MSRTCASLKAICSRVRPDAHLCVPALLIASLVYIGTTRKEEIERFSKASKDTDFARMLKARILNPDHLETQSQLRREIRVSILQGAY